MTVIIAESVLAQEALRYAPSESTLLRNHWLTLPSVGEIVKETAIATGTETETETAITTAAEIVPQTDAMTTVTTETDILPVGTALETDEDREIGTPDG